MSLAEWGGGGQGSGQVPGPQLPALEMLHGKTLDQLEQNQRDLHGSQPWKSLYFSYAEGSIGGKPITFKNQRTQRGGRLGWCEGTPTTAWALVWALDAFRLSEGKATHPYLFLHFTLIYFCISSQLPLVCSPTLLWRRESNLTAIKQERHHPRAAQGQQQRGQCSSSTGLPAPKIKHFVPGWVSAYVKEKKK